MENDGFSYTFRSIKKHIGLELPAPDYTRAEVLVLLRNVCFSLDHMLMQQVKEYKNE